MECLNSTKLSSPCTSSILNLQGSSSLVCNKFYKNSVHPWLLSSPPPKPFLQLDDRLQYRQKSAHKTYRRAILAEAGNQGWDLGRFLKTLYFFNGPPSPAKFVEFVIGKLSSPSPSEPKKSMGSSDIVLVVGATGGVGRRVVDVLLKKGLPVRVLARNEEKARKMLGPDIDLIIGDITKESTLAKYSQGIKFFEPEIKGDSPEMVEFVGMRNLINAIKGSVGLRNGKLIFGCEENGFRDLAWGALDDVVMGGVSESTFLIDTTGGEKGEPTGLFKGTVSTTNNGGFTSIRTRNFSVPEDLSAYDGLELHLKALTPQKVNGNQYACLFLLLSLYFELELYQMLPPFDPSSIISLQLMFSKFEYDGKLNPTFVEGPFQLPVSSIRTFIKDPVTPRFVHVSSAGVTRPDRPGLDLSKQPPAVRLNKELDFILTFKLKGEDLIRESGIPYAIVRPCALTEEPAGADLIFDQGDNITGKISREEVARICIAALESPYACDKTFEVKSVIPFSEPFTVDLENPPQEKDYEIYFKDLKDGITGKELLEQSPVPV
ncbi:hypothetical protein OIU84_014334 [Salix udensis]|uniref:NAD(P)-binding Rossmann-fold superfamily protein n=1 Tax=Salix udensis TaxID=889485 RepID=A0AAD6NRB6_9ROSI|nr:hypothetical protein OIU84_014334 [Salix udensis]